MGKKPNNFKDLLIAALEADVKDVKPIVIPHSITFSSIEKGQEDGDPIEFGKEDNSIEQNFSEYDFIAIIKMIPTDKLRVIALMLFLKEIGYNYTQNDIASIWGNSQPNIFNRIKQIRKILSKRYINKTFAI